MNELKAFSIAFNFLQRKKLTKSERYVYLKKVSLNNKKSQKFWWSESVLLPEINIFHTLTIESIKSGAPSDIQPVFLIIVFLSIE